MSYKRNRAGIVPSDFATKNAKVITITLSSLQDSSPCAQSPSLTSRPPSKQSTTAFRKLSTDSSRSSRLSSPSSPTSPPSTTDYSQTYDGRAAVHAGSNTAPIAMLIVDKVVEEDRHMRPRFIQLGHFHKTFALEMIESVLTNYHQPTFHKRYDALATDGDTSNSSSARVSTLLISALKHLVTSRPILLWVYLQATLNHTSIATTALWRWW
ncbi:hypothetical protein BGY98DRAFT_1104411 [Russula aff. rugulosa BPL654]|nr:hypothetical protein BGY98DRAFT_1104411 [Russula aff. rugulosa BPL654]